MRMRSLNPVFKKLAFCDSLTGEGEAVCVSGFAQPTNETRQMENAIAVGVLAGFVLGIL